MGQMGVAQLFANGMGTSADVAQAAQWLEIAVGNQCGYAAFLRGVLREFNCGLPTDLEETVEWVTAAQAAKSSPAASAQPAKGMPEAGRWYDIAMEMCCADENKRQAFPIWAMGNMRLLGIGAPQSVDRALAYYRAAADLGSAEAMRSLGRLAAAGAGVVADGGAALVWYEKAAARGNRAAYADMGELFAIGGAGLQRDMEKAVNYYRQAAERCGARGMFRLGEAYARGEGVAQDGAAARRWYAAAAERHCTLAADYAGAADSALATGPERT